MLAPILIHYHDTYDDNFPSPKCKYCILAISHCVDHMRTRSTLLSPKLHTVTGLLCIEQNRSTITRHRSRLIEDLHQEAGCIGEAEGTQWAAPFGVLHLYHKGTSWKGHRSWSSIYINQQWPTSKCHNSHSPIRSRDVRFANYDECGHFGCRSAVLA